MEEEKPKKKKNRKMNMKARDAEIRREKKMKFFDGL